MPTDSAAASGPGPVARGKRRGPPVTVNEHRPCGNCGYDLVGLDAGGVCPECGTPIHPRNRASWKGPQQIIDAPMPYLRRLALAARMLAVGWFGLAIGGAVALKTSGVVAASITAGMALLWWVGSLIVTMPRPGLVASSTDPHAEWAILRLLARVSQAFWVIAAAALVVAAAQSTGGGSIPVVVTAIGVGALAIATLGTVALNLYIGNLAFWAGDTNLFHGLRAISWLAPWAIPVFFGIAPVCLEFVAELNGPVRPLVLLVAVVAMALPSIVPVWYMHQLWGFQRIAAWSIRNRISSDAREDRLRKKAEEAGASAAAAAAADPNSRADRAGGPVSLVPPKGLPASRGHRIPQSERPAQPFDIAPE